MSCFSASVGGVAAAISSSLGAKLKHSTGIEFTSVSCCVRTPFGSNASILFGDSLKALKESAQSRPWVQRGASANFVASADVPPTVADTKSKFLQAYKRPIPSIYNNVIQELIVQQHLMRYNANYRLDSVFALGFVTVWDQLMDGFPEASERDAIFRAYIEALTEDPEQYKRDAAELEEWAAKLDSTSLVEFSSRDGPVESSLKDISERAKGGGDFHYSRFFAIGLFRLLELTKASEPATLEKLCAALNVSKKSVDRDLDVYRGLLSKLTQAKDLLRDYLEREKVKQAEREKEKASVKAE